MRDHRSKGDVSDEVGTGGHLPADSDRALAPDDQTLADEDQTLGDRDRKLSDRDQQASNDDQAASDWDRDHPHDLISRELTTADRAETSRLREQVADLRFRTASERDAAAQRRDDLAALHDEVARTRDDDAAALDVQDDLNDGRAATVEEVRARARASRLRAASDRARASRDREQAASDRLQAARDREQAAHERESAGLDELTGTRRRGIGLVELEREMTRARRENGTLVAAYVDVNGLKEVNDSQGHAVGDQLLKSVADQLREHMRGYDLIVRLGGDEFLCAVPSVSLEEARRRFADLASESGPVSVGFSELREIDTPSDLIARADGDLLATRRQAR